MPPLNNVSPPPVTTTACNVCGTQPPPVVTTAAMAAVPAAATTTPAVAAAQPTVTVAAVATAPTTEAPLKVPATTQVPPAGPGPVFAPAGAPQDPYSTPVAHPANSAVPVTKAPSPAPKQAGSQLNDWIHQQFPKTPKDLNVPMVAGLAAGGAAVAGGVIAAAVESSKHPNHENAGSPNQFLGKAQGPAPAVHRLPSTVLTEAVQKGATTLEVASVAGFALGDTIKVGDEYNLVKGFSSLILDHPMNRAHPNGVTVEVVHEPANAQVHTTPPLNKVLGEGAAGLPSFKAKATPAPEPAAAEAPSKTMIYCILAGVLLCCLFWCAIGAVAIMMRHGRHKRRTQEYEGNYSGLSDEEESVYEDSEDAYPTGSYRKS